MLSDVVVVFRPRWVHAPAIHAASHFDHGNRVAWFSIMIFTYTCSSLPIVVVLRLAALPGGRSPAMKQWHTTIANNCSFFQALCSTVTVVQFFFHTALFAWMLVEGINLYIKLVKVFSVKRQYVAYLVIGWGKYSFLTILKITFLYSFPNRE